MTTHGAIVIQDIRLRNSGMVSFGPRIWSSERRNLLICDRYSYHHEVDEDHKDRSNILKARRDNIQASARVHAEADANYEQGGQLGHVDVGQGRQGEISQGTSNAPTRHEAPKFP